MPTYTKKVLRTFIVNSLYNGIYQYMPPTYVQDVKEKTLNMMAEGKTDGIVNFIDDKSAERYFTDTAAAQEFIDYLLDSTRRHGLQPEQLFTCTIQDNV